MKTCGKESQLQYGRVCYVRGQKARCPRATSVTRYPRAVKNQIKSDQCSRNRKDQLRARTLRASPTFTCVTAASLPAVSAASWRSPRHSLLPSRPGAASSLSFAPALPTAAAACRAAPRRQRARAVRRTADSAPARRRERMGSRRGARRSQEAAAADGTAARARANGVGAPGAAPQGDGSDGGCGDASHPGPGA